MVWLFEISHFHFIFYKLFQVSSADQNGEAKTLVTTNSIPEQNETIQNATKNENNQLVKESFLDPAILKHLQRELTYETVDLEFDKIVRSTYTELKFT